MNKMNKMNKILGFKLYENKSGKLYANRRFGKKTFSIYVADRKQAKARILKYCEKKGIILKKDGTYTVSGNFDEIKNFPCTDNTDNIGVSMKKSTDKSDVSMKEFIERLDKLEAENLYLLSEIKEMKKRLPEPVIESEPKPLAVKSRQKSQKKAEEPIVAKENTPDSKSKLYGFSLIKKKMGSKFSWHAIKRIAGKQHQVYVTKCDLVGENEVGSLAKKKIEIYCDKHGIALAELANVNVRGHEIESILLAIEKYHSEGLDDEVLFAQVKNELPRITQEEFEKAMIAWRK